MGVGVEYSGLSLTLLAEWYGENYTEIQISL